MPYGDRIASVKFSLAERLRVDDRLCWQPDGNLHATREGERMLGQRENRSDRFRFRWRMDADRLIMIEQEVPVLVTDTLSFVPGKKFA